jgi:hypothetical protein
LIGVFLRFSYPAAQDSASLLTKQRVASATLSGVYGANSRETVMRDLIRHHATALSIMCLVVLAGACNGDARAQTKQEAVPAPTVPQKESLSIKQMPLTEKQIQSFIAATPKIFAILAWAPEGYDEPSPQTIVKLDAIAQKNGFASYQEYEHIGENIGLVNAGIDDLTRKYVGREAQVRLRIARIKADKKMSAADKNEELEHVNDQLEHLVGFPRVQYKGNIDLVIKYYDRIQAVVPHSF